MQILTLDGRFRLTTTHLNWVLQRYEEITNKATKEVRHDWKDIGYFGNNLAHALKRYVTESLRDKEDNTDVHTLLDRLKELEDIIEKRVKKEQIELIVVKKDKEEAL